MGCFLGRGSRRFYQDDDGRVYDSTNKFIEYDPDNDFQPIENQIKSPYISTKKQNEEVIEPGLKIVRKVLENVVDLIEPTDSPASSGAITTIAETIGLTSDTVINTDRETKLDRILRAAKLDRMKYWDLRRKYTIPNEKNMKKPELINYIIDNNLDIKDAEIGTTDKNA